MSKFKFCLSILKKWVKTLQPRPHFSSRWSLSQTNNLFKINFNFIVMPNKSKPGTAKQEKTSKQDSVRQLHHRISWLNRTVTSPFLKMLHQSCHSNENPTSMLTTLSGDPWILSAAQSSLRNSTMREGTPTNFSSLMMRKSAWINA